ncbi:hypothetical protein B0H13DRAFT_2268659 [Mycena leptocephala]|nr:hypothetical protein B0H13DRAFT_2268659 [Mycena leptocephala]
MALRSLRPLFASCARSEKAITNLGIFGGPGTWFYDDGFPVTDVVSPVVAVGHSDHYAGLAATVAVGVVHAVRDGDHAASTFFKASDFLSYVARLIFVAAVGVARAVDHADLAFLTNQQHYLIRPILLRPFTIASAFCTPVGLRLLDLHLTIQSVNSNRSGARIHRLRHAATPNLHLAFDASQCWVEVSQISVIFPPAVSERACRAEISTAYSSIPLYLHCLIPSHNIWPSLAVCSFRDVLPRLEFPVGLRLDTTPT